MFCMVLNILAWFPWHDCINIYFFILFLYYSLLHPDVARQFQPFTPRLFFSKWLASKNLDLRCVLISDLSALGVVAQNTLHTPKAVTYHEQYHTL